MRVEKAKKAKKFLCFDSCLETLLDPRAKCSGSGDFKSLCSEFNLLRTKLAAKTIANRKISIDKAERAKPLRPENRSCKFNSHDPN